jgi:serine/threonine-protein kinase
VAGWADSKSYKSTWEVIDKIPSGAQGDSFFARSDDVVAFLKALKANNDKERRARFYQEASAYFRLEHPRLPKFIESNAQHFREHGYMLYLVCEKIDGVNLEATIEASGPLIYQDSLAVAFGLLDVLQYLHSRGYVHRDVKPGNIILKGGKPDGVMLVDLGIGHDDDKSLKEHETDIGQELGNRFLRLPELSIGSDAKRDPRTDLAFVAGVLLYCLTGIIPANLLDQAGKMPHQRDAVVEQLKDRVPKHALFSLLNLFDKSFSHVLATRYESAVQMRDALTQVRDAPPRSLEPTADELMNMLEEKVSSARNANLARVRSSLDTYYEKVAGIYSAVASTVAPVLSTIQTGQETSNTVFTTKIGFVQMGDRSKCEFVKVVIRAMGDELVLQMNDEVVHRTSLDQPAFGPEFEEATKKKFASTALAVEEK